MADAVTGTIARGETRTHALSKAIDDLVAISTRTTLCARVLDPDTRVFSAAVRRQYRA